MKPTFDANGVQIYLGDCREVLRQLPSESVHTCVTSPPYWGLRDYGTAQWDGGLEDCDHQIPAATLGGGSNKGHNGSFTANYSQQCGKCGATRIDRQIGLEDSPVKYIATMREVFAEVRRVLRSDGVMFLNMGDSYWSNPAKGGSGTFNGRNGRGEGYARAQRVDACDTSGKAPEGYQESDCLCGSLCGACREAYRLGKSRSGYQPVPTPILSPSSPIRGNTASLHGRLPTLDSFPLAVHSEGATLDQVLTSPRAAARPLSVPQSTKSLSSAQLLASNLQVSSLGVKCLLCAQTLDDCALGFSDKTAGNQGNGDCTESSATPCEAQRNYTRYTCEYCSSADSYSSYTTACLKPKDLCGIPWMLAFALREDGWYLRQDIIWAKPNPMPESVTDRCTKSHEYIFLLSKSERYYYNQEAILEPWTCDRDDMREKGVRTGIAYLQQGANGYSNSEKPVKVPPNYKGSVPGRNGGDGQERRSDTDRAPRDGRNKRSVWEVTTQPFPEAHFATFPQELIKPCILAGCPEGGTVLDPFMGSGTTGLVARSLHSKAIGIELNPAYIEIAAKRLQQEVLDFSGHEQASQWVVGPESP